MNKARKDKKEEADKLSNAQAYNLLNNQYTHLQKLYQDLLIRYQQKEDEFKTSNPILNDLCQHEKKSLNYIVQKLLNYVYKSEQFHLRYTNY